MAKASAIKYIKVVLELTEEEAEYLKSLTYQGLTKNESATTRILRNGIWTELGNILDQDD